jgi:hypothetical protein
MSLQIKSTVSFDNACVKNSSVSLSEEEKAEKLQYVYQSFGCLRLVYDSSLLFSVEQLERKSSS